MRALLLLALAAAAQAASIHGMVREDASGHPLIRTYVVAEPLAGTRGSARGERTGLNGEFSIADLAPGNYLITASHRGFAPVQYGQKRWGAAGLPLHIDEKEDAAIEIRMARFGAIAGKVIDENNVGIPGHAVGVYRDVRPLLLTAQGLTDDRGVFRIFGLEPGNYLVRALTHPYEDETYVPSFFKDSVNADKAIAVPVELETDSAYTDIHAVPGALFKISGVASMNTGPAANVLVTLSSDTGSLTMPTGDRGEFEFPQLAPGRYELSASGHALHSPEVLAGFESIVLDRDYDRRLLLERMPELSISVAPFDGAPGNPSQAQVLARRSMAAGPGKVQQMKFGRDAAMIEPGYWEFALTPSSTIYPAVFTGTDGERIHLHADGWNRVLIKPNTVNTVKFEVASNPASVAGMVKGATGNGVAYAPVFLEPTDLDRARRLTEFRWMRADANGRFTFAGVAPGVYRVMGTFEFLNPEGRDFERAQAEPFAVAAGQSLTHDVDLYVIRQQQ